MRQPFTLPDTRIAEVIREQYGLQPVEIALLAQGGDIHAVVYRVITQEGGQYFLKFLQGVFDETAVRVPRFLQDQGIRQVIAPLPTIHHTLWAQPEGCSAILYPYIAGQNAFELALTARQWVVFGAALKRIHSAALPTELSRRVQQEAYDPQWRDRVRRLLARAKQEAFDDPTAAQYAGLLKNKADEITSFAEKAERLGSALKAQQPPLALCHSDIHAGNLLIDAEGSLYIIDWDHPILAPKERDLMFIGGGVGSAWHSPKEEDLFYEGYGRAAVNPVALAYYRFERIIQDIAEWGERILFARAGVKDRPRVLQGLIRWFSPNDVVAMAYRAERMLPPEWRPFA